MHTGGYAPFGYDIIEHKYVINEFEAVYMQKMFDAAAQRIGFTALIDEMALCGIKGKRGRPIKYPQIYEILRNEKYTGLYKYSPKEETKRSDRRSKPDAISIEGAIPAIVSKEQFEEVRKIMSANRQARNQIICVAVWCTAHVVRRCTA